MSNYLNISIISYLYHTYITAQFRKCIQFIDKY